MEAKIRMLGFRRSYLEPIQLERLKTHKYTSKGTSLFEVRSQERGKEEEGRGMVGCSLSNVY